tara:strand:+ start:622 stop:1026 length:405 start_codon:yes stop_codon:yes gene_type:complete
MFVVEHAGYRKKHTMFDENMCLCVEADEEQYPTITEVLRIDDRTDVEHVAAELLVPYSEFRELVFWLPEFEDLAILFHARKMAGDPTKFIVKCFDGPDHQMGDRLLIDTQGYDYARYKAAVDLVTDNPNHTPVL